ncbi:MAG: Ig-like domain-containing protein [Leptolyngbyaceae bacterium]|nr:Ig-like domain-containing protein [Leptolyngbyaceae bacterium]
MTEDDFAPVAVEDAIATSADTPVTFDPAANDTDADNLTGELTVTAIDTASVPADVAVTLDGGLVTVTPTNGFSGDVTVGYTVADPGGNEAIGTATVTVAAVADTIIAIAGGSVVESGDIGTTDAVFTLTADDPGFSGDVLLDVSINGGVAIPETVSFITGSATIIVPVANDDLANDTDTVEVTLSNPPEGFAIGTATATFDVTEDDGPVLSLTIDPASIAEDGGVATGTVTRNTPTDTELVITLSSDDPSEATVPQTVTIPIGQASVTFDVAIADDTILDGSQTANITATSDGFDAVTASLVVTDNDAPTTALKIEAEDINPNNVDVYRLEGINAASNGQVLSLVGFGGQGPEVGMASFLFSGASGLYDVFLGTFDEVDGAASFTVEQTIQGGTPDQIGSTIVLDQNTTGSNGANNTTKVTREVGTSIQLFNGATIKVTGFEEGNEHARFDFIEFIPSDDTTATPPTASNDTVTTDEANAVSGNVLTNDTGTPTLTIIEVNGGANVGTEITLASGALLTLNEDGTFNYNPNGQFDTLNTGETATDSFTYLASNDQGVSEATVTVTINGISDVNSPPTGTVTIEGNLVVGATLTAINDLADADGLGIITYQWFSDGFAIEGASDETFVLGQAEVGTTISVTASYTDGNGNEESVASAETTPVQPQSDPLSPEGDLDNDGIINALDDDIDGDGSLNADDPFRYDAENGVLLATDESIDLTFDTDADDLGQSGFTGFLQGKKPDGSEPPAGGGGSFDENTGASSVSNGLFIVNPVTAGDTGNNDNPEDDAQVGIKNAAFTIVADVVNPWFGPAPNANSFDQIGIFAGLDSSNMVKMVFGQSGEVVEVQSQIDNVGAKTGPGNGNIALPTGAQLDDFASARMRLEVELTGTVPATAVVRSFITFLGTDGQPLSTALTDVSFGELTITGSFAEALADPTVAVGAGFTHVNGGGDPTFIAQLDRFTVTEGIAAPPDTVAPTVALAVTPIDTATDTIVVTATFSDDVDPAGSIVIDGDELSLVYGPLAEVVTPTFINNNDGTAVYTFAAPAGGWAAPIQLSVVEASFADTAGNTNGATTPIVIPIGTPAFDPFALEGDLDLDGIPNNADADIDGDGVTNLDDRTAYRDDSLPAPTFTTESPIVLDFTGLDDGATPFEGGFTGVAQTSNGDPELNYADNTASGGGITTDPAQVQGGRLVVQTTNDDTADADSGFTFLADTEGESFVFSGTFDNPVFNATDLPTFSQYGLILSLTGANGVTGVDFAKLTTGNPGGGIELSGNGTSFTSSQKPALPTGVTQTNYAQVLLSIEGTVQNGNLTLSGKATYLDETGGVLGEATTTDALVSPGSPLFNALTGVTGAPTVAFGITSTDFGSGGSFDVALQDLTLSKAEDGVVPPIDDDFGLELLNSLTSADGIATGGTYGPGAVGSAELDVMSTVDNIQSSNFGQNSFQITNTGDKNIAAVFIDFRDAIFRDSVVDPDGSGGDSVAKLFQINSGAGDTAAFFDGNNANVYYLPGDPPLPNTTGTGQDASGGFRGLLLKAGTGSNGFEPGESIGFSGDMDPNSIAGLFKSDVDSGATLSWDVGGISGAEIAGSKFVVLFDDGTTATGYLGNTNTQAGSLGEAVEGQTEVLVTVEVNGGSGVYGGTEPTIIVSGPAGQTVDVVLAKGFQPVTNDSTGSGGTIGFQTLVENRLADDYPDFPVNNAFDFQKITVTIGAGGTVTVPTGAFDYITTESGASFAGSDVAPIAVGAVAVNSEGYAIGPVDRQYLTNPTGTPVSVVFESPGFFTPAANGNTLYYKIQIEDAAALNGGTDPNGKWNYEAAPDSEGRQTGFQGNGYYLYGSNTSTSINGVIESEILAFEIDVPEELVGETLNFRARVSRDGTAANDQQNDLWLGIERADGTGTIEEFLVGNGTNDPEPTSQGFIKIFGGTNAGSWSYASAVDGAPNNFGAAVQFSEAGRYVLQIAGRSQGYHIDWIELYEGSAPAVGAVDSTFVTSGPQPVQLVNEIPDQIFTEGVTDTFALPPGTFDDPNDDPITYEVTVTATDGSTVSGVTIDENTGQLAGISTLAIATYTVTITATDVDGSATDTFTIEITDDVVPPPADGSLVFSLDNGQTLNGLDITPQDLVQFDGTNFSLLFDGSDVGVNDSINAFDVISDTEILLSFNSATNLPGLGAVDDSDIVRFTATSLGNNTAGTFSLEFDGSNFGLSNGGEDIDAVNQLANGNLLISTTGNLNPGSGIVGGDDDIVLFDVTSGSFSIFVDGSDIGLGEEDINAFSINAEGDFFFSSAGVFTVPGVSGSSEDVFAFTPTTTGVNTSGSFASGVFFDGSAFGLTGNSISGLDVTGNTTGGGDPTNTDPIAVDDDVTTDEANIITGNVLNNNGNGVDSDPDGNPLTVTAVNGDTGAIGNTILLPSGALLTINSDGTFSYNPNGQFDALNTGQTATDNFSYTIDDNNGGTDTATVNVTITGIDSGTDTLTVTITPDNISENGGTATGTVTRTGDLSAVLTVSLDSSDTGEATVPASVEIGANQASATFSITAEDDAIVDGTQIVAITASAEGLVSGTDTLSVTDDDDVQASLSLSISDNAISENGGIATGTITRTGALGSELTVTLNSSDTSEATVPNSVVIGANEASTTFQITAEDDAILDGTQTVTITASAGTLTDGATIDVTDDETPPTSDTALLFSLDNDQVVNGISVTSLDIVQFDGSNFSIYFDGSDLGLEGKINAFDVISDTEILISFSNPEIVPGLGSVDDSDIVKFTATSLGENTAGSFSLHFDGSDVGLSNGGENIDAITGLADGSLLISSTGNLNPGSGVVGSDEDVVRFTPSSLGDTTSGSFSLEIDNSAAGLSEDIDAFSQNSSGANFFSTLDAFSGVGAEDEDVVSLTGGVFFDGSQFGLAGNDITGVDLTFTVI